MGNITFEHIVRNPQLLLSEDKIDESLFRRTEFTDKDKELIDNILKEPNYIELLNALLNYNEDYILLVNDDILDNHFELGIKYMMVKNKKSNNLLENKDYVVNVNNDINNLKDVPDDELISVLKETGIAANTALHYLSSKQKGKNIEKLMELYGISLSDILLKDYNAISYLPINVQKKYKEELINILNEILNQEYDGSSLIIDISNVLPEIRERISKNNTYIKTKYKEAYKLAKDNKLDVIRFIVNENGEIYYSPIIYHEQLILYTNSAVESARGVIKNNELTRLDVNRITMRYGESVLSKLEIEGVNVPNKYWRRFFNDDPRGEYELKLDPVLYSKYRVMDEIRKRGRIPLLAEGDYIIDDAYYKAYHPELKHRVDIIRIHNKRLRLIRLANKLDKLGKYKLADRIDEIIRYAY